MDADRWARVQALFHDALARPEAEREALLEAASDDPALVADVRALLDADADGGSLLEQDLARVAQEVLDTPPAVPETIGPYRIRGVLGEGGMGVVYLAERDDLGRRAAIKVLRDATLSPARRERFAQEQLLLAQLRHPAIAQLYDADALLDGTPYFVMEHVSGVTITDYCATHRCSVAERLRLVRAVCEAVAHAHRLLIIHRDLKPSNILVAEDAAGRPQVKLLDFGIAKPLDRLDAPAAQTRAGLRLMTPAYAAPEQFRGEPVGVHTDVYALGVLLYELLAGRLPFDLAGLTPGQAEALLLEGSLERPSDAARETEGGVPGPLPRRAWADLDVLCLTAMHRDPARRYPTTEALIRDLDHFLAAEPLEARPDTLGYRAGKFLRRNRQAVAAAAVVVALVVGLVAFYTARLAEQRNRAQAEALKAEQVSDYLIGLFEAADPYAADSLSVQALLRQGEAQAEALDGQPALQAQMLDVLGRVYVLLSDYERAEPLLLRAVALRRSYGTPLDVAESLVNLGELLIYTGEHDRAEAATREALTLREAHLPPGHPDLATTLDNLGVILSRQGDYEAAGAYYGLALRIRRALYDAPHEDLGYSLNNVAVNLYRQGDYDAAERHYREAIAVDRAVFGARHPNVATGLANLGKLFEDRGDYDAADSLLSEALAIRRAALGDEHYETALSLSQLGGLLRKKGALDRAEPLLREALALREQILGPDHPSTATTRSYLALVLQDRGDYAAAEGLFRRALDAYRTGLGDDHWFTGVAHCRLAHLLDLLGEEGSEVERRYREGLAILEAALPPGHPALAEHRSQFGAYLTARARYPEAESLLTESHARLRDHHGDDHPATRAAARRLAALYEAWERPVEPTPLGTIPAGAPGRTP